MIGIYFLTVITELLRFFLVFHNLLGIPLHKGLRKYALLLYIPAIFSLIHFVPDIDTLYLSIIIIVINFTTAFFLYDVKKSALIKIFIAISFITVIWDSLIIKVIRLFSSYDEALVTGALLQQCICNIILIVFLSLLWFLFKRFGFLYKLNYRQISNTIFFLILSIIVLNAIISSMTFILSENGFPKKPSATYIAVTFLSILFQVVCIILIYLFYSRERYKTLNRLREEYNEKQIDYYKTLLVKEEDTRKFRHDIQNHIICIEELLNTGKVDEAKGYIKDIHSSLSTITKMYDTGSDIINAIINYYANKGASDHILIQVKGRILQDLNIPMMHLSTIISNLMSNAYEATTKIASEQDKIIQVELHSGNKYLEIIVKNPTIVDRVRLDGRLISTKADTKNHGFGLQNIRETLLKYDGDMQIKDDTDSVTVRITMKIA